MSANLNKLRTSWQNQHSGQVKPYYTKITLRARLIIPVSFLPRCMECQRGLATRKVSVRLSVRPSVCQTRALWQNGRKTIQIFIPYWEEEWLVVANPYTWNLGSTDTHWSEIADFQSTLARSASAVALAPSQKSSIDNLTLIGKALSNEPKMNIVHVATKSPHWGSKMKNGSFQVKSHFAWMHLVYYKVSLCETVSDKVVRHSLAYLYQCENDWRGRPFYVKIGRILTHPVEKRQFSIYFRL